MSVGSSRGVALRQCGHTTRCQGNVDLVNVDGATDPLEQRDGELAAKVLLEAA